MTDAFQAPTWVSESFARADELAAAANSRWTASLGPLGQFGGFQVTPVSGEGRDAAGTPIVLFRSTLFGGRHLVGSAHEVEVAQRAFILSRRPIAKKRKP